MNWETNRINKWNWPTKGNFSFFVFRETTTKIDWERDGTNKNIGTEKGT